MKKPNDELTYEEFLTYATTLCQLWGDIDPDTDYKEITNSRELTIEHWDEMKEMTEWYRLKGVKLLQQGWKSYQLDKCKKLISD